MLFGSLRTVVFALPLSLARLQGEVATLRDDVRSLKAQVKAMSTALDNLKAAVAAQVSVDQSGVTLIQGIAGQLKSVSDDADVQALADQLTAATGPLVSAVTANTPAAPVAAPTTTTATPTGTADPSPAPAPGASTTGTGTAS